MPAESGMRDHARSAQTFSLWQEPPSFTIWLAAVQSCELFLNVAARAA